ncbi:MAG: glycosyltransferase family 2 protein [Chloroflexi bacterium]|nr:glycosyltransferase family 2 protein [Chloroflexota bacterium]
MKYPRFSIIVTTHNRPALVMRCVESLLTQDFPSADFEIIVVDDGSHPRTINVLASYRQAGLIHYLYQSQQGWGAARLNGVRHSRGEIMVFLDDDCQAPPTWLSTYAAVYEKYPQVVGVGGGLRYGNRMNVAGWKQYHGHMAYFDHLNAPLGITHTQAGRVWFTFGGNRSFRKTTWLSVQPKSNDWYFDDYSIDQRLREQKLGVYYEPAAWVEHFYFLSLPQRLRSAYRYGRSEKSLRSQNQIPSIPAARLGLWGRWQRMKAEAPEASNFAHSWYALTQPLIWLARRWGRNWS